MQKKMLELYNLVEKYNYAYHTEDKSLISDYEYDKLVQELEKLEQTYPQYKKVKSITEQVGNEVISEFNKVEHQTPMLSLNNAFSYEDLLNFDQRIQKELGANYSYVCELKIDGIAISLEYVDGKLNRGITRGNGLIGEDVTHNVKTIATLPQNLTEDLQVRGEIYLSKKNFLKIQQQENVIYANPRNLAAGTIRQLNNQVAKSRGLSIFTYGLVNYEELTHTSYFESMMYLKKLGFATNEKIKQCATIAEVYEYVKEMTELRSKLDYEIDGIVIKVNEYNHQQTLGFTAKYPKWAIAYKFKSDSAITKLLDILYTVGRTGKVTPNAILEPVFLMGSTIGKATLHNEDYILEKKIKIGDQVKIIKAGDIIPRVEEVVNPTTEEFNFTYPKACPECHESLVKKDKDYFCLNNKCPGKNIEKIIYFVSPSGFDIKGLGNKIIEKLYEKEIVNDIIDIFDLNYEKLYQLEGFKEKSVMNLLTAIEEAKKIELANFLTAFGIKNLGLETAKTIAQNYQSITDVMTLSEEQLNEIEGIGKVIAHECYLFWQEENNQEKVQYLLQKQVIIINSHYLEGNNKENLKYSDKTFVITGKFTNYKRSELKSKIEALGGKVSGSVSTKTNYVLCGIDAGSKKTKAQELNILIIFENQIEEFLSGKEV